MGPKILSDSFRGHDASSKQSCDGCKRKKVKCVVKDGYGAGCVYCARKQEQCVWSPPRQHEEVPDVIAAQFVSINKRLQKLEAQMAARSKLKATYLPAPPLAAIPPIPPSHKRTSSSAASHRARSILVDDAEDAALALENVALRRRRYNPASIEFITNADAPALKTIQQPVAFTSMLTTVFLEGLPAQFDTSWIHSVPERGLCDILINNFFDSLSFLYCIVCRSTFMPEYWQFWNALERRTESYVDPGWLAIFFRILAVSTSTLDIHNLPSTLQTYHDSLATYVTSWSNISETCFSASSWRDYPQVRTVINLLLQVAFGAGEEKECDSTFFETLASAIRVCGLLRFDRLGSDPWQMPGDDPALPQGSSVLKREIVKRMWWYAVAVDGIFASATFEGSTVWLGRYKDETALPLNADECELGLTMDFPNHPPGYISDWSLVETLIEISNVHREASNISRNQAGPLGYDTILDLDGSLRLLVQRLESGALGRDPRLKPYGRVLALTVLHNRLLRLHRPFFMQRIQGGPVGEKYAFSVKASLISATALSRDLLPVLRSLKFLVHRWFLSGFILNSVLVLWMSVMDQEQNGHVASYDRSLILLLRSWFSEPKFDLALGNISPQAISIIDHLLAQRSHPSSGRIHSGETFRVIAARILQSTSLSDPGPPTNLVQNLEYLPGDPFVAGNGQGLGYGRLGEPSSTHWQFEGGATHAALRSMAHTESWEEMLHLMD